MARLKDTRSEYKNDLHFWILLEQSEVKTFKISFTTSQK